MIIHVKQACEFTGPHGEKFRCPFDYIGQPPEWVANDAYFKDLCHCGLITAHIDNKSVDAEMKKEEEAPKRGRKA